MGAELNAGTGKETTSVYSRVLDATSERASTSWPTWSGARASTPSELDQRAPDRPRGDRDVRGRPAGQGLRRPRRGGLRRPPAGPRDHRPRAESWRARPPPAWRAFHAARYVPRNVVVAAAGSVDHDAARRARARGRSRRGRRSTAPPVAPPAPGAGRARARALRRPRTPSSTTCASARPGIARDDERRFALRVLDNVLGGTSSSRLFQEVREKRGLAYSVFSFQALLRGHGAGRPVPRHAARQRRASAGGRGRRARALPRGAGHGRGARALQGERQGAHRAVAGVDDGAHEPPRLGRAGRAAAAERRRARRAHRRGDPRRRARPGRRAVRPRAPERRRDRRRRGRLPRGAGAVSPGLAAAA